MTQAERNEEIRVCREIIKGGGIKTHRQFLLDFQVKGHRELSTAAIHRLFKRANIAYDFSKKEYYCVNPDEDIDSYELDNKELFDILHNHSNGIYTHEKSVKTIWLSVTPEHEQSLAKALYEYCDKKITIMVGYGCISLRCRNIATQNKLKLFLQKNFSWNLDSKMYNGNE